MKATPSKKKTQNCSTIQKSNSQLVLSFPPLPSGDRRCKSSASFHTRRELNLEPRLTTQFNENHLMLVKRVYSEEERKKNNNPTTCFVCWQRAHHMCTQSHTHTHTHKLDNGVQVGKAAVTAGCCLGVVSAGAIVRTLAPPLIIGDE